MAGYIEELQAMFNRMEEALEQYHDHIDGYGSENRIRTDIRELKRERRKLRMRVADLKISVGEFEDQIEEKESEVGKAGAEVIRMIAQELQVNLTTVGALFKKMRKAGFIFLKNEK